jgi:hypothetical protein
VTDSQPDPKWRNPEDERPVDPVRDDDDPGATTPPLEPEEPVDRDAPAVGVLDEDAREVPEPNEPA